MVLSGPWWERILQGIKRTPMPGGDRSLAQPIPVQLGIPLNEYLEDLRIYTSARIAAYEELVAYGARRVALEHAGLALGRAMIGDGPVTDSMRRDLVGVMRSAILGTRVDMQQLLQVSLGEVVEYEAWAAGEFQDVWASYRTQLAGLPPWQVPPVGGFAHAVRATDPNWYLQGFTSSMDERTMLAARDRILSAYLTGESVESLTRSLRVGLRKTVVDHQRLARTSLHRVAREYQKETYAQNSVVEREKYIATLDSATCPVCGNYDGKKYALGEGPVVPVHDNCRCTYAPITLSVREILGMPPPEDEDEDHRRVRASMDGKVPVSTTWPDWLARKEAQTPGFARDILGPTRYDAWVAGELKLGALTRGGKQRTLAQLGLTR